MGLYKIQVETQDVYIAGVNGKAILTHPNSSTVKVFEAVVK